LARKSRWGLAAIVVLAMLVRVAILARGSGRLGDPDNYLPLAWSLARGEGFALRGRPTAYRPPLYPLVLVPIVRTFGSRAAWGVSGFHVVLGLGTVVLTALAARRWGLSEGRTLIAAAIVACDPVLVAQTGTVMTEPLAAFLVAGILAALARPGRWGPVLGGILMGLASLTRPSLLPFAALTALAALLAPSGRRPERLRRGMMLVLVTAAMLVPWAWRNARVLGEPIVTTTHGGYTLALANNPAYYDDVLNDPSGTVWSGPGQAAWFVQVNTELAGLPEPEADRRLRAAGLRMVVERPRDFARAALARLGRFWSVAPSGAVYPRWLRVASAAWTIPLWLALLAGLGTRATWRWPRIAAPAALAALSAVHAFYWTDLRMRAPLVPAIALVAATAHAPNRYIGDSSENTSISPPGKK
jgi:hypothetical protein